MEKFARKKLQNTLKHLKHLVTKNYKTHTK